MMKKVENKKNSLKIFWKWLGQQNIFLVFLAVFILLFFASKIYANYFPKSEQNAYTLEQVQKVIPPSIKITKSPLPSPSIKPIKIENNIDCKGPDGVIFKTTKQKCDELSEAREITESDEPELINCTFADDSNCAKQDKKVTADECKNLRCCKNYKENKYVVETTQTCDGFLEDELSNIKQKYNEDMEKYLNQVQVNIEQQNQNNCKFMLDSNKMQSQNLEGCRNWVAKNVPRTLQIGIGNPQDNPAYGNAYTRCFELYGTDPYPEASKECLE